jgi:hypothetical protein
MSDTERLDFLAMGCTVQHGRQYASEDAPREFQVFADGRLLGRDPDLRKAIDVAAGER